MSFTNNKIEVIRQKKKPKTESQWSKTIILIDTREQSPYTFEKMKGINEAKTVKVTLKTGDYSFIYNGKDYSTIFAVERKSWEDWIGSITSGRERFENEIKRLNDMDFGAVVIEQDVSGAYTSADFTYSKLSPALALATFYKWSVKYPKVHFYLTSSRTGAKECLKHLIEGYIKYYHISPSKSEIAWHKGTETVPGRAKNLVIGIES